jgi:hypothetical protein
MSRLQQGSLLKLKRKSGPDVWVFRWYEETGGTRTYRKRTLGTVARYPHLRDAEKAADALRNTINSEFTVPETVSELVTHYRKYELTEEKKAYATIEANTLYLANHIVPKWGAAYLQDVRTVDVELWLHTLKFAPGTRSKIRNIMSAIFNGSVAKFGCPRENGAERGRSWSCQSSSGVILRARSSFGRCVGTAAMA